MPKKSLPLSQAYQLLEPGPVIMVTTAYKGKSNVMTLTWHMMVEFEPALVAFVMSSDNYSFNLLKKSGHCVINIPTVELIKKVVEVGNTTGTKVDKFKKFNLAHIPASKIDVPMLTDCYANLECKVVNTKLVDKYNIFILEIVKAWITPSKTRPRMIHHEGRGVFIIDGDVIKMKSNKK